MATVYVWTAWGTTPHSLWRPPRDIVQLGILPPDIRKRIDGGYCPGSTMLSGKLELAPEHLQIEGQMRHYFAGEGKERYTILACWDRSCDGTRGSNTTFVILGWWDMEPAIQLAKTAFPEIWERLPDALTFTNA